MNALAFALLCIVAVWDIRHKKIPNILIVIVLMMGVVRIFILKDYVPCVIGIAFPSAVLFALRIHSSAAIGFGDIKLVMAVGFFYGYLRAGIIVMISLTALCIYALIRRKKRTDTASVCFGPFLAGASLIGFIV